MLWPWNAAALQEIMAGASLEGKRGGQTGEQQASNGALPEREGVECGSQSEA